MRTLFLMSTGAMFVTALVLLGSVGNIDIPPQAPEPETKCRLPRFLCSEPKRQKVFVQSVLQPNNPEVARLTEDKLHMLSRRVQPKHVVEISLLSGAGSVEVLYSASATRQAMQEMHWRVDSNPDTVELDPTPSDETALVNGVQRLPDRIKAMPAGQELHFYLVTEGTSDPRIIAQLQAITASLASEDLSQVHIYVIGLSEQNRLNFSAAFSPIASNLQLGGGSLHFANSSDSEWMPLVRKF